MIWYGQVLLDLPFNQQNSFLSISFHKRINLITSSHKNSDHKQNQRSRDSALDPLRSSLSRLTRRRAPRHTHTHTLTMPTRRCGIHTMPSRARNTDTPHRHRYTPASLSRPRQRRRHTHPIPTRPREPQRRGLPLPIRRDDMSIRIQTHRRMPPTPARSRLRLCGSRHRHRRVPHTCVHIYRVIVSVLTHAREAADRDGRGLEVACPGRHQLCHGRGAGRVGEDGDCK